MKNLEKRTAYGSRSYSWRTEECTQDFGYDYEWQRLKKAVIYKYTSNIFEGIADPDMHQILEIPDYEELTAQLDGLCKKLTELCVDVMTIETNHQTVNSVFQRDLYVPYGEHLVIGKPSSNVRAGEEQIMASELARIGYPIHMVNCKYFETSDFLKTNKGNLFGTGNRSKEPRILRDAIHRRIPVPKGIQHLLGAVNIIGENTALIRSEKLDSDFHHLNGMKCIALKETDEVKYKQAMNVLTIDKNEILMPDDCPETQEIYEMFGIKVHTVNISELRKLAGGIACAVGVLHRK